MIIRDAILISFIMPSKLTGNILRRHCHSIWFQVTAISEGNIFRFISLQKQTGWIASVMILSNCLLKGSFQLSLCLNGQQVSSSISVQYNCHSCKVNLLTFPLHQTEIYSWITPTNTFICSIFLNAPSFKACNCFRNHSCLEMRRYIIESQAGAKIHPFVLLITFYTSNHRIVTDWQFLYFKGSFYVRQSIPPEASLRPVVFPEGGKIGNSRSLHPWQESRVFLVKNLGFIFKKNPSFRCIPTANAWFHSTGVLF